MGAVRIRSDKEIAMSIKVVSEVNIYRIDGVETRLSENKSVEVKSVGEYSKMIYLVIDGKTYEVAAADLEKAIRNAINC